MDVLHAKGGFNDQFKPDAFFAPFCGFDLGRHHIKGIDIRGRSNLGDHDQIKPVAGLFKNINNIAVHIMCIKPVDAHRQHLIAPINVIDRSDDVFARLFLVTGRNRVFEIKENGVGF